jgi:hypothetical protein
MDYPNQVACPKCGASTPREAYACPNCGKRFRDIQIHLPTRWVLACIGIAVAAPIVYLFLTANH